MSGLCIFPKDETTAFLKPIANKLKTLGIVVCDGDTNDVNYTNNLYGCIPLYDNIAFLGHGSSDALSGTNQKSLIDSTNVDLLRRKSLFLLACNSKEFISSYDLKNAIGFDIIPTGEMDVSTIVDQDYGYFENIPDDADLEWFRSAIVRIVENSFNVSGMANMTMLYNMIKMFTNRERYACIRECKELNYRDILRMLYDFKDCMIYKRG